MTLDPADFGRQGRLAYEENRLEEAAELFSRAAEGFSAAGDGLMSAEMKNNASVALLKAGRPREALEAAGGTEEVFGGAQDLKRQAMALGNQAAALEALGRGDEAVEKYDRSAELFHRAGEGDLRTTVMKSSAAIKLKAGRITEAAFRMIGVLEAKETPSVFERFLRFILKSIYK
jgi:tetratricopeptide (TPR) repeat protein